MIASFRRTVAGLLAVPALATAQAPVVPMPMPMPMSTGTPAPVAPYTPAPTGTPAPVVTGTPAPVVAAPVYSGPAVTIPDAVPPAPVEPATADEPAAEPDRYLIEGLLAKTAFGKQLTDNGFRVYGWTEGVYTPSTARRTNFPLGQNDRANNFQMTQNYIRFERVLDTEKKERQFGFQVDGIVPGTDPRLTVSRGLFPGQFNNGEGYGFDMPQAFVRGYLPEVLGGTSFQVGKFFAPIGYESIDATATPFASRSYNFLYNPYTVTGGMASINLTDDITAFSGFHVGNDQFINHTNRFSYIGGLKWAPKDGKTSVAVNVMLTDSRFDQVNNQNNYNVYNAVLTHSFTDKLRYALDFAFSHQDNIPGVGSAHWYGFANYLFYDVTDTLAWNHRVEFFQDEKGVRVGTPGLITAVTSGLNWHPTSWFVFRPEVRYDFNSGGGRGAFENGDRNLFTAGIGAIVRW